MRPTAHCIAVALVLLLHTSPALSQKENACVPGGDCVIEEDISLLDNVIKLAKVKGKCHQREPQSPGERVSSILRPFCAKAI
jgi:hypothetical protein